MKQYGWKNLAAGAAALALLWVGAAAAGKAKPAGKAKDAAPPAAQDSDLSRARQRAQDAWDALNTAPPATGKAVEALRDALHYLRGPGPDGYKYASLEVKTGKVDIKEGWRTLASMKVSALEKSPQPFKVIGGPVAVVSVHVPNKISLMKNNGDVYLAGLEIAWRYGSIKGTLKRDENKWLNRGDDFQVTLPVVADEVEVTATVATREADAGKTVVEMDARVGNLVDREENPDYYLVVVLRAALTALGDKDLPGGRAYTRAAAEILAHK